MNARPGAYGVYIWVSRQSIWDRGASMGHEGGAEGPFEAPMRCLGRSKFADTCSFINDLKVSCGGGDQGGIPC